MKVKPLLLASHNLEGTELIKLFYDVSLKNEQTPLRAIVSQGQRVGVPSNLFIEDLVIPILDTKKVQVVPIPLVSLFEYELNVRENPTPKQPYATISSFTAVDKTWERKSLIGDWLKITDSFGWAGYGTKCRMREFMFSTDYGMTIRLVLREFDRSYPVLIGVNVQGLRKGVPLIQGHYSSAKVERFWDGKVLWEWNTAKGKVAFRLINRDLYDETIFKLNQFLSYTDMLNIVQVQKSRYKDLEWFEQSLVEQVKEMQAPELRRAITRTLWTEQQNNGRARS